MGKLEPQNHKGNLYVLKEGDDNEYKNLLKTSDKLVAVDFFATWCGPCKMIGPKFTDMANDFDKVVFVKIDVDEFEEIAEENEINCMPTFVFYWKNEKVETFSGANVQKLREKVEELAKKYVP